MPIISADEARRHVRGEAADDADLLLMARAAERVCMQFLNRQVYATVGELTAAVATVPGKVAAAQAAFDGTLNASYSDTETYNSAMSAARVQYAREIAATREIMQGMVVEDDVKIAMLLLMGHFFMNREAVTTNAVHELPLGVRALLWPHRVAMGV